MFVEYLIRGAAIDERFTSLTTVPLDGPPFLLV